MFKSVMVQRVWYFYPILKQLLKPFFWYNYCKLGFLGQPLPSTCSHDRHQRHHRLPYWEQNTL